MQISGCHTNELFIIIFCLRILTFINIQRCQQIKDSSCIRILLINTQKYLFCFIITLQAHINFTDQAKDRDIADLADFNLIQNLHGFFITLLHHKGLDLLGQRAFIYLIILQFIHLLTAKPSAPLRAF